jgi:beta-N-acetylhexosaminidase
MHYGPVMIDIEGQALTQKECSLLKHPAVGGVILFTRNYGGLEEIKALVAGIRREAGHPLLIAVDHEGGRVWRFRKDFTVLPSASHYGAVYARSPQEALLLARNAGWIMASELLECGIDLSFAPVLDLDQGISDVIGDRGFHSNPAIVSTLAKAFIEGMNAVGMRATGKHFPGHGGCSMDSHLIQASDPRSLSTLLLADMVPFKELSSVLGAIMPAHVIYPAVDSVSAGYSKRWLQEILRQQLQFKGAIISDCLSMEGAAMGGEYVVRARMALDAGCNMVILCQQERDLVQRVLDELDRTTNAEDNQVLSALAGRFNNENRKVKKSLAMEGF